MKIRKTKLIATIGPACDAPDKLKAMMEAGMNVARLNFSHGTAEDHRARLEQVRNVAHQIGANVATMVDTRGIEIRTGRLSGGAAVLVPGAEFSLLTDSILGDPTGVSVSYDRLPEALRRGSRVLLDDGKIELSVIEVKSDRVRCRVECGGTLRDRKGVNVPDTELSHGSLDPHSHGDLAFAAENQVEYVAASFVQTPEDVRDIREFLASRGADDIPIIAKIENRVGVANLAAIIHEANGTMVARGDLGVELPMAEVPHVQKKIIKATVSNGKPVITATQMLDSMERNPRPTRAEVSDVANAILDGTSAVMLSGETAAGSYPVEAVRTMASLALEAEGSLADYGQLQHINPNPSNVITEAVAQAAITMANHLNASAIIALTESGFTARMISKYRPTSPILAATPSERVVHKLAMNWGVIPIRSSGTADDAAAIELTVRRARTLGYLNAGDVVVATAGHAQRTGGTNMIRVLEV
ncbi:MAG: pyruvate kinase [Myxococcota bacterium]